MTATTNKKIAESKNPNNMQESRCVNSSQPTTNYKTNHLSKRNKSQKDYDLKQQHLRLKFNHMNMNETDTSQLIKSCSQSSLSRESSIDSSDTDDTDEGIMITSSSNKSTNSSSKSSLEVSASSSSGSSTPNEPYYSGEEENSSNGGEENGLNKLIKDIRFNFLERNKLLHLMQVQSFSSETLYTGANDEYYLNDVVVLIERDHLIKRFIDPKDPNVDISVKALEDLFRWRKSIGLRNWTDSTFPVEFYTMNGMFITGLDKQHMPVMYMRAKAHRQWTPKLDELFKNFVAYQVDKLTKLFHYNEVDNFDGEQLCERGTFTICFDCRGATYASLDMEFLRFLVKLLVNYYPQSCKYAIVLDIPWIFRSVWRLVKTWLPADCQETVKFVPLKQLIEFIDVEHIPACMQTATTSANINTTISEITKNNNNNNHKTGQSNSITLTPARCNWQTSWPIPDTCKSIAEFKEQVDMTQSQVKAFLAHIEKLNTVA